MSQREDLLEGAIECLLNKGFAATTARDIAAASSANLAAISYHYGSKDALLTQAIAELSRRWTDEVLRASESAGDAPPLAQTAAAWSATLDSFDQHSALIAAFLDAVAQAGRSEELRTIMAAHYQELREAIAASIVAALGTENPGLDVSVLASWMLAVGDGFIIQWVLDPQATPSGTELVATLATALGAALATT